MFPAVQQNLTKIGTAVQKAKLDKAQDDIPQHLDFHFKRVADMTGEAVQCSGDTCLCTLYELDSCVLGPWPSFLYGF